MDIFSKTVSMTLPELISILVRIQNEIGENEPTLVAIAVPTTAGSNGFLCNNICVSSVPTAPNKDGYENLVLINACVEEG